MVILASGHLGYAGHLAAYNGYTGYTGYSGLAGYSGLNTHYIGKREADSDADAYTIAQVYNGLPYANAVATGHAHNPGYVAYTSHSAPVHTYKGYLGGYNGYTGYTGYSGLAGYSGLNTHYIGKREADSDADAYTIAQVYNGLPYANAVATGHAHNPGYVAYT